MWIWSHYFAIQCNTVGFVCICQPKPNDPGDWIGLSSNSRAVLNFAAVRLNAKWKKRKSLKPYLIPISFHPLQVRLGKNEMRILQRGFTRWSSAIGGAGIRFSFQGLGRAVDFRGTQSWHRRRVRPGVSGCSRRFCRDHFWRRVCGDVGQGKADGHDEGRVLCMCTIRSFIIDR